MSEFNPYEAPSALVADLISSEDLELADRGTRLGAKLLDGLIMGGTFMIIGFTAALSIPALLSHRRGTALTPVFFIVFGLLAGGAILAMMIWNILWLSRYGQTIAKRVCKIKIVRANGERVDMGRLLGLRIIVISLIELIPFLGPLFSLVNVCFIFRDDRRCIHDLMADTIVVKA